jgi:hypothetical protein
MSEMKRDGHGKEEDRARSWERGRLEWKGSFEMSENRG